MLPCYALASGFLTGKYRPGGAAVESARAGPPAPTWTRAARPCWVLDRVAAARQTTVAAVALAWLRAGPRVIAPSPAP